MRFSQVETYWLYPVFSPARPAPRNLSIRLYKRTRVTRMQNTAPWPLERSRWPESNRQHRILLLRFLQLSYSGICAAGRKRQSPAAIGKGGRGMDNPVSLLSVIPNIFWGVYTPFLIIYHGMMKGLFLNFRIICSPDKIINGHIVVVRYTYKL